MTRALSLTVLLAALGCTGTSPRELWREKAGPKKVSYTGSGVTLGELGKPAVTTDAFARRTTELLQARRTFSATQYVERYADIAAETLRTPPAGTPSDTITFITQTLGDRRSIEVVVESHLKEGESRRQASNIKESMEAWTKAVEAATDLLEHHPRTMDPLLWSRIASLRLMNREWPKGTQKALARAASGYGLPGTDTMDTECLLWTVVGRWHMDRLESHSAVTALKRAETLSKNELASSTLRIWQAQSLIAIGQETTAVTMLMSMTTHPDPIVAGPALATLGAVKLQGGAAQQAMPILEKAIALPPVWLGRPEALGDYAIAMMLTGNEANGEECLRAAESAFQAAGDMRGLLRAMNNEAEYLAAKGGDLQAIAIRQRMAEIENAGRGYQPVAVTPKPSNGVISAGLKVFQPRQK